MKTDFRMRNVGLGIAGIVAIGGLVILGVGAAAGGPFQWVFMAVVGVAVLLILLTLMSFIASVVGLGDPKEALGLPAGSIRAVIALALVVIFIISLIYLNESVARPEMAISTGLTFDQVQAMQSSNVTIVRIVAERSNSQLYDVSVALPPSQASQDLSKQVITLVGTLMASVASFYFGMKAGEGSQQTSTKVTVTGINPNQGDKGDKNLAVVLSGTNFGGASAVSFGTGITVNSFRVDGPTQIKADISLDDGATSGTRDVSVITPADTGTLAAGFTIS